MFTDASQFALGGKLYRQKSENEPTENDLLKTAHFQFSTQRGDVPIHIKEAEIIVKFLLVCAEEARNCNVTFYCDNAAVVAAFNNLGAKDMALTKAVKWVVEFAYHHNIRFNVVWTPTKLQKADGISRELSLMESKLRPAISTPLYKWLKPEIDLFASDRNRLQPQMDYYSKYPEGKKLINPESRLLTKNRKLLNLTVIFQKTHWARTGWQPQSQIRQYMPFPRGH